MSFTRRDLLRMGTLAALAPMSRVLSATQASPDIDIELTARPTRVRILPGAQTNVWQYSGRVLKGPASSVSAIEGSYLGPTLRLPRGARVRITFRNGLPDPSIVHWHGLDVPESADGHPRFAVAAGGSYTYEFTVTNRPGTYWYHPHPHMQTGPQVYSGLAGLVLVTDDAERALGLPSGAEERVAVIQDRRFDAGNQLVYSTSMMDLETGMLGDRILVNGQPTPTWDLATRAYRIRVLNGSNARIYKLAWSDETPLTVLGCDGGLLQAPLTRRFLTLAPGQRADLWLDLSARAVGSTLRLTTTEFALGDAGLNMSGMGGQGMMGRGMGGGRGAAMAGAGTLRLGAAADLLTVRVARRERATAASLPARLSTFEASWQPTTAATAVRTVPMTFRMMQWFLAGRTFSEADMTEVAADETVQAGSTGLWEFVNAGGPMGMQMAHPIHIHGRQFRVISRTGGAAGNTLREGLLDDGWMDTVLVLPQETVRVQIPFSEHRGLFLYHCHILEHEDMGMMRNFRIV